LFIFLRLSAEIAADQKFGDDSALKMNTKGIPKMQIRHKLNF